MPADRGDQAKEVIDQLQVPVPDLPTLLALLSGPLDSLGLLPPQYRRYNIHPLTDGSINIRRHIPAFQRVLLQHIAPTWDSLLAENHTKQLLDQYFCPDSFSYATPVAGEIAMLAFSTIISLPLTEHAMRILQRLAKEYPIDRLHTAAFARKDLDAAARDLAWEDCIRNIVTVPAKVANAAGTGEVLPGLQHATYFNYISERTEVLLAALASKWPSKASLPSVAYLMSKLVNLGVFPPSPPVARSQPSFFQTVLPTIRSRLLSENAHAYSSYWAALITNFPSSLTLQSILTSLYASLSTIEPVLDVTPSKRALTRRQAWLLSGILGDPTADNSGLWETATNLITGRDWDESFARIFACWVSGGSRSGKLDAKALDAFLENVLETWSSADHIKHSLLSRHRYMTGLFLITISYFPASSEQVQGVALSPMFIRGIGTYISHSDLSVRRCGMLAGEVVAHLAGKKLDFRDWDGDDSGKPWARDMRELLKARDMDADLDCQEDAQPDETGVEEISTPGISAKVFNVPPKVSFVTKDDGYDSDDSVTGYASPPSSRSASPTPSDLADIEKDPTLIVGVKKVPRPVYLVQLGNLVRGPGTNHNTEDPHDADKIEMALNCAEELIRKKIGYGTELDENAVNLVHAFLGLQDNYDLDDFGSKRQGIMNALVSCAPRKAAPSVIEEFFKNQYSTDQRYVALNALAIGARELASLPVPPSTVSAERIQFPSKTLPGPLHDKYIKASRADQGIVPRIMDGISSQAIDKQKEPSSDKVPQLVRERRLRINKPPGITEVSQLVNPSLQIQQFPQYNKVLFTEVAAEYFIVPLVNRFWLFLRDEQTREERTVRLEGRSRYYGAGTGLILNPVVLSHFLRTLAILVNASQNAPEWLAIIAPDTLELAVTIGTRPISHIDDDEQDPSDPLERGKKEASVLTSALELALVVLDGSLEIDGGKSISLEHTALLLGTGEWASKIFANLDKGMLVEGGGGVHEMKLRRATAGVLLKVDDLTSRWRRSMLDTI